MAFRNLFRSILGILLVSLSITSVNANSYYSEAYSSESQCDSAREGNNTLYPSFYRSECFAWEWETFFYNICDTNYCVWGGNIDKFKEQKDPWVYQYDSSSVINNKSDYKLDEKTTEKVEKIAQSLEKRFQKMSQKDLDKWSENFFSALDVLSEKSKWSKKNTALIAAIKDQVWLVVEKQTNENDLCENQYWYGWKEAEFYYDSKKTVTGIEWNKKWSITCEYDESVEKKETSYVEEKKENKENNKEENNDSKVNSWTIDVYTEKPITDEQTNEEEVIDITQPVQGIYRATKNKYLDTQTSIYTQIDVCTSEYWIKWNESKEKNIDAYIMLYSKYNIETSGYTVYWNWKKLISTPKDKLLHKACILNTLDTIVDDKYRVTQWKYRWNILREWDICKTEYGNWWKVTKEEAAYTKTFAYHAKKYKNLSAWVLYPNTESNDCGWYHSIDNWNGVVYWRFKWNWVNKEDDIKKTNSCSYNPDKKQDLEKYHNNFVCEKDTEEKEDITPVVQWIYKVTTNKYSYNDSYNNKTDLCKVEYGRSWKVNKSWAIDANIMLFKEYWVTTWIGTEKNSYFAWDWKKEIQQRSSSKNHVTCIEDERHLKNENYEEYLTEATVDEIHSFMKKLEQDMLSKIKDTKDFVYINDSYAVTKKLYYWNQIYSSRVCPNNWEYCSNGTELKSVCPIWYKIDDNSIHYNKYEKELLWKYIEKNLRKYYNKKPTSDKVSIPFWIWSKWDEQYVRRVSLDDIKKEATTRSFAATWIQLQNASSFMKGSYWVVRNDTYVYGYSSNWSMEWPSTTIWTLLPVICVNKNKNLNSWKNANVTEEQNLKWVIFVKDPLYINGKKDENDLQSIFFAYEMAKIKWFFNDSNTKEVKYFLPIRQRLGSDWYRFLKKRVYNY